MNFAQGMYIEASLKELRLELEENKLDTIGAYREIEKLAKKATETGSDQALAIGRQIQLIETCRNNIDRVTEAIGKLEALESLED